MHHEDTRPSYPQQQPARVARLVSPESSSTEPEDIVFEGEIPTCVDISNPASESSPAVATGNLEKRSKVNERVRAEAIAPPNVNQEPLNQNSARAGLKPKSVSADEDVLGPSKPKLDLTEGYFFDEPETQASQSAEEDRQFPLQCLPDTVRTMAEAVAKSANVAIELVVLSVLAVLSTVIGKYLRVTTGPDRTTSANLYILGFALSGTGKSEAVRHVFKALHEIQQSLIANWKSTTLNELDAKLRRLEVEIKKIERDLEKEEDSDAADGLEIDLAEKLRTRQTLKEETQSPPKIYTEDCTPERMAILLQLNGEQLTSLSEDASKPVQNLLGRYNKLDMVEDTLLVKGYSLDPFVVDRQSREPVDLEEPCINLFWLTQPDKIPTLFANEALTSGGFLPRCLVSDTHCEPRKITGTEEPIPIEVREKFDQLIHALFGKFRRTGFKNSGATAFVISPLSKANQIMIDHYNSIVERRSGELRDINSFAARWNENTWRLAINVHAAKYGSEACEHQLEEDTVCDAIEIAKWFEQEQLRLLARGRQEHLEQELTGLREYLERQHGTATLRQLKRSGWSEGDIRHLVANSRGMLTLSEKNRGEEGGRPSVTISLNQQKV
jgi:Protein of unknown function (DUF3987)